MFVSIYAPGHRNPDRFELDNGFVLELTAHAEPGKMILTRREPGKDPVETQFNKDHHVFVLSKDGGGQTTLIYDP